MALHELLNNAAKYGALSNDAGRVAITWGIGEDRARGTYFHLSWGESGGPPVSAPRDTAWHDRRRAIPRVQLEAEVAHEYARAGVSWRLVCRAE